MSTYNERYEAVVRKAIEDHNDRCDKLDGKTFAELTLEEHQFIYRVNPGYYKKFGEDFTDGEPRVIDANKIRVYDYSLALHREREKAKAKEG